MPLVWSLAGWESLNQFFFGGELKLRIDLVPAEQNSCCRASYVGSHCARSKKWRTLSQRLNLGRIAKVRWAMRCQQRRFGVKFWQQQLEHGP